MRYFYPPCDKQKLVHCRTGSFPIVEKLSDALFCIQQSPKTKTVHNNLRRLKAETLPSLCFHTFTHSANKKADPHETDDTGNDIAQEYADNEETVGVTISGREKEVIKLWESWSYSEIFTQLLPIKINRIFYNRPTFYVIMLIIFHICAMFKIFEHAAVAPCWELILFLTVIKTLVINGDFMQRTSLTLHCQNIKKLL